MAYIRVNGPKIHQPPAAMIPFKSALQAMGQGLVDLSAQDYEMLFVSGYDPSAHAGDGGHDFENDVLGAGGVVAHRQAVPGVTWVGRTLDAPNFTVNDPAAGTATWAILIKAGGTAATNRLIAYWDIADVTFDGVNDQMRFHPTGMFRVGAA